MHSMTTDSIWQELSGDLRRFIRRRVADDHAADDLLQEVFLRIHRSIATLADSDRLTPWVYRIARNVVTDHHRRSSSESAPLESEPADAVDEAANLRTGACRWMDELVSQVPEPYQTAVRLAEFDGLTQQEIATRTGLSLPGAKSRVQRGRAMLKDELSRCCVFHTDARGKVVDCDPKPDRTVCRDCDPH